MRPSIGLLALLLFLGGCAYFNDPGEELILNLDSEFEVAITENLIPEGRELKISLTAIDEIKCDESELLLVAESRGALINIKINDIIMADLCAGGNSNPAGEVNFNLRSNTYDLLIEVKDHTVQNGFLEVSPKTYDINLDNAKGLIIDRTHLNRIPNNFAWGYYQAQTSDQLDAMRKFLEENSLSVRPLTEMTEGFYSYFSIDREGSLNVDELPYSGNTVQFGFTDLNLSQIQNSAQEFKDKNPGLKFQINFSDGVIL